MSVGIGMTKVAQENNQTLKRKKKEKKSTPTLTTMDSSSTGGAPKMCSLPPPSMGTAFGDEILPATARYPSHRSANSNNGYSLGSHPQTARFSSKSLHKQLGATVGDKKGGNHSVGAAVLPRGVNANTAGRKTKVQFGAVDVHAFLRMPHDGTPQPKSGGPGLGMEYTEVSTQMFKVSDFERMRNAGGNRRTPRDRFHREGRLPPSVRCQMLGVSMAY